MKKPYITMAAVLIIVASVSGGCSTTKETDEQQIVDLSPTSFLIEHSTLPDSVESSSDSATINFIVDRTKVKETDLNISVDDALELLIEKEFKDEDITSSSCVFSFEGYECLEDGTCYIISCGSLEGEDFIAQRRFAVSYNKTIYEAPLSSLTDGEYQYTVIYSLDKGQSSSLLSIEAAIKDGTLTITDQSDQSTLGNFPLKKYGLENATNENLVIMDLNFDKYLDVAITTKDSNEVRHYYVFLYKKKKDSYIYETSYQYLNDPIFNYDTKTISCNSSKPGLYIYDTYDIVNSQPEISKRVSYTYQSESEDWKMEQYEGTNGNLVLRSTKYYTTDQACDITGDYLATGD